MPQRLLNLKNYFLSYFDYNLLSNCKLLSAMDQLPDTKEAMDLFRGLITAHRQWLRCLTTNGWVHETTACHGRSNLKLQWTKTVNEWCDFLSKMEPRQLETTVLVVDITDGHVQRTTVRDVASHLNSLSLNTREQIVRIFRMQNCEPPFNHAVFSAAHVSSYRLVDA